MLAIPTHIIKNTKDNAFLRKMTMVMRKSLKLGENNMWLAKAAIENLNKIVDTISLKRVEKYLNFVLPFLSTYLRVSDKNFI